MVMFAESDYNAKEHARLLDAMFKKKPPENEVNLIEGDDDTVTLERLPAEEKPKGEK